MFARLNHFYSQYPKLISGFYATTLGALLVLAFAPFNFWIVAFVVPGCLLKLIAQQSPRQAFVTGCEFGIGLFAVGASWVYVSIHLYGEASPPLAIAATALLITTAALFYGVMLWGLQRSNISQTWIKGMLVFPALWVISEWLREITLTGFPWLFLGYTSIDSPLSSFAPLIGVYGLSFLVVMLSSAIFISLQTKFMRWPYILCIVTIFTLATALQPVDWTQPDGQQATVSLVQANIPQELKWERSFALKSFKIHSQLSQPLWAYSQIVVWPEAAITFSLPSANKLLDYLRAQAQIYDRSFITGIPILSTDGDTFYNAMIATGNHASGVYKKHHLVPFGEYVPLKAYLSQLLTLFNLPSDTAPGPKHGALLKAQNMRFSPAICYEVAYPNRFISNLPEANALITVSNDALFGDSLGPKQHAQMARMRALELGRYLIHAANTGVTELVNNHGAVVKRLPSFERGVLTGTVFGYKGLTPIARFGHQNLIAIIMAIYVSSVLLSYYLGNRRL